jgi:hypothetical protein
MNEYRDNSDMLTFDFHSIEACLYKKITSDVITLFNLEVFSKKIDGFDEVFQEFKNGNEVVGLEWDIWSGYIVNAKTKTAEPLVREIAGYINAKFYS